MACSKSVMKLVIRRKGRSIPIIDTQDVVGLRLGANKAIAVPAASVPPPPPSTTTLHLNSWRCFLCKEGCAPKWGVEDLEGYEMGGFAWPRYGSLQTTPAAHTTHPMQTSLPHMPCRPMCVVASPPLQPM